MAADQTIKRVLLKPLTRRRQLTADHKGIVKALERLDTRAVGEEMLSAIVEIVRAQLCRVL
jgi:hypothetical protein